MRNGICAKGTYRFILAELLRSTRPRMKRILLIFVLGLLCNTATCSTERCESHDYTMPFHGRYCPTEGIIVPNLAWHQCKLYCLQQSSCQAVNYDFAANLCTYFITTCPLAINHPNMAFVMFTGRQIEQCIEWIPMEDGNPTQDRSVTVDNERFAARMHKDGNDFIGFWRATLDECYSHHDVPFTYSDGYPCQYLRIRDGCTVYFVNYELGTLLPPTALIGGYTADGLPLYIGRKKIKIGYYIPGSNRLVVNAGNKTDDVKILVLL